MHINHWYKLNFFTLCLVGFNFFSYGMVSEKKINIKQLTNTFCDEVLPVMHCALIIAPVACKLAKPTVVVAKESTKYLIKNYPFYTALTTGGCIVVAWFLYSEHSWWNRVSFLKTKNRLNNIIVELGEQSDTFKVLMEKINEKHQCNRDRFTVEVEAVEKLSKNMVDSAEKNMLEWGLQVNFALNSLQKETCKQLTKHDKNLKVACRDVARFSSLIEQQRQVIQVSNNNLQQVVKIVSQNLQDVPNTMHNLLQPKIEQCSKTIKNKTSKIQEEIDTIADGQETVAVLVSQHTDDVNRNNRILIATQKSITRQENSIKAMQKALEDIDALFNESNVVKNNANDGWQPTNNIHDNSKDTDQD